MYPMINLPNNPTPEQFAKAEPVLVKQIIEGTYTSGVDSVDFRRVKPGKYTGEFRDGKKRFMFSFEAGSGISYKPINPEEID